MARNAPTSREGVEKDILAVIKPKRTAVRRSTTKSLTEKSSKESKKNTVSIEDAGDFFSSSPLSSEPNLSEQKKHRSEREVSLSGEQSSLKRNLAQKQHSTQTHEPSLAQIDPELIEQLVSKRLASIEKRFQERIDKLNAPTSVAHTNPTDNDEHNDEHDDEVIDDFLPSDWGLNNKQQNRKKHLQKNRLDFFLYLMIDRGSSDFHFHVGSSPTFRKSGDMVPMRYRPIRQRDWARFIRPICPPGYWERWEASGDIDFAYEIEGLARFRVNLFRQHSGGSAVFRVIPSKILTLEELGMPPSLMKLAELKHGLVLITGPTGSGKSTTLAALIHMINKRKAYHIITLEDPIEFVHKGLKSIVHQREIGTHSRSFSDALNGAVREDPDLILVGEMRDRETIRLALEAAEKGVLVFGTLHTNSATKTIDRIINVFPITEQDQIRSVLADTVEGVVSQQLLRRKSGGRVAALEIMFSTSALGNIIREGKTTQLASLIQTGQRQGMVIMDDSLNTLIEQDIITPEAALEKAIDKDRFKPLLEEQNGSKT